MKHSITVQRLCLILFTLLLTMPAWSKTTTWKARNRNKGEVEGTRYFSQGSVTWSNCKTGPALIPGNRNWKMASGSTVTITCKEGWRVRAFYVREQLKNADELYCSSNYKDYTGNAGKTKIECYDASDQSITITALEEVQFAAYAVEYVQVRPISFKKSSYTIYVDQVIDTPLDQMVNNPSGSSISWNINRTVAEIQNGKVKGMGAGTTYLGAILRAENAYAYSSAYTKINVLRHDIHPSLDKTAITLKTWENSQLPKVNGLPNDYDGQITYESSDNGVAVVEGGKLKFGGSGYGKTATITVNIPQTRKYNGATLKFTVNVDNAMPIASKGDWKKLCDCVESGLSGINVKLMKDVDLGSDIMKVGTYNRSYTGTFDGQGHTLTFNWNGGEYTAPFHAVDGATIKNLRTKGKIKTRGKGASGLLHGASGTTTVSNCASEVEISGDEGEYAGLVNTVYPGGNVILSNCVSEVKISPKKGRNAGMIRLILPNANVTINDCLVKGSIEGTTEEGRKQMVGFVSGLDGSCTLNNCLYLGKNNATSGYTFAPRNAKINNCYYLNRCGEDQGWYASESELWDGRMAYKLQNKRAGNVWGQTLGADNAPLPTSDAAKHVCQVDFTYKGRVKATRYANNGKSIFASLPTAQELLGSEYDAKKTYKLTYDGGFSASTRINGDRTVAVTMTVTTGINDVTNDAMGMKNGPVYNLQGARVADRLDDATRNSLPAGVYIVGGRKVIVK